MTTEADHWRPGASPALLQRRARMLQQLRAFFANRQVLEVETPLLSRAAASDPHLSSLAVNLDGHSAYLHTSPEFFMKRLLVAGSGPIYQVCKVFRGGEQGRRHNPEFSLLEWYRPDYDHHALMQEVEALVRELLAGDLTLGDTFKLTYRQVFIEYLGLDPMLAGVAELQQVAADQQLDVVEPDSLQHDAWLDLLLTHVIEPRLPVNRPVFIYDYPASQAALARLRNEQGYTVASRFELYINGMELANGFHELADASLQQQRFIHDLELRRQMDLPTAPLDEKFLAALGAGLPDCAGVALGLDRLLMLAGGCTDIDEVLSFGSARV